jgi:hypothetical protein
MGLHPDFQGFLYCAKCNTDSEVIPFQFDSVNGFSVRIEDLPPGWKAIKSVHKTDTKTIKEYDNMDEFICPNCAG